jgi:hypothetical protein
MFIPQAVRGLGWRRGFLVAAGVLTAVAVVAVLIATDARLENIAIRLFGGFISKTVEKPQGMIYTAVAALGVTWLGIGGLCLWERWLARKG